MRSSPKPFELELVSGKVRNRSLQKLLNWLAEKVFDAQRPGVQIDGGSRYFQSLMGAFCTFGPQVPDMSALFREAENHVISNVWVVGRADLGSANNFNQK